MITAILRIYMRVSLFLGLTVYCTEQRISSSADLIVSEFVNQSLTESTLDSTDGEEVVWLESEAKVTRGHNKNKVFGNLLVRRKLYACSAKICGNLDVNTINGRPFPMNYAYIYSTSVQTIAAGAAILFDQNSLMTSAFSHSTTSNTDQIIVNVSGVYRIDVRSISSGKSYFAVSINGVVPHPSLDPTIAGPTEYGANTGGAILSGQSILQLNAGDVLQVTNFSTSSITINNQDGALNPFTISASILIQQLA